MQTKTHQSKVIRVNHNEITLLTMSLQALKKLNKSNEILVNMCNVVIKKLNK